MIAIFPIIVRLFPFLSVSWSGYLNSMIDLFYGIAITRVLLNEINCLFDPVTYVKMKFHQDKRLRAS